MICLTGFEPYSRWVPLKKKKKQNKKNKKKNTANKQRKKTDKPPGWDFGKDIILCVEICKYNTNNMFLTDPFLNIKRQN